MSKPSRRHDSMKKRSSANLLTTLEQVAVQIVQFAAPRSETIMRISGAVIRSAPVVKCNRLILN